MITVKRKIHTPYTHTHTTVAHTWDGFDLDVGATLEDL